MNFETSSRRSADNRQLTPGAAEGREPLPPQNQETMGGETQDFHNSRMRDAPRDWRDAWLKEDATLAIKAWKAEKAGDIKTAQEIRRALRD